MEPRTNLTRCSVDDLWLRVIRWGFAIGGIAGITNLAAPEASLAAGPRAEARRAARLANQQGVPVTPWQPAPVSGGQVFEPYPGVRITVSPPGSPLPYGPSSTQGYTPNGGFPGGSYPSTGYPAPVVIDPYTGLPITNQVVPVQGQVQAPLNQTPLTPIPEGIGSPVTTYSGPNSAAATNPAPANPAANNAVGPDGRPLTPAQKRRRDRMGNGGTADIASRSTGDQPTPLSPDDGFSTSNFNGANTFNGPILPGMSVDPVDPSLPTLSPMPATGPVPINAGKGTLSGSGPLPEGVQDVFVPIGPSVVAPYQVYVSMQERFINRFVATTRNEPGEVRDFILGANVVGERETTSHAWLNLLPSTDTARGQFVLEGRGQSRTTGYTPQASINTQGSQEFRGTKDVLFDGFKLATRAAVIQARAHNTPVSAQTVYSGRPFIGPIADRIAMSVAQRQQSQAEIIARDRVAETVFASFNKEVDKELGNANAELKQLQTRLEDLTLMPSVQRWSSTHAHLQFAGQFGADVPQLEPMPAEARQDHAVTIFLHETVLNRAAVRANLNGKVTSDKELKELSKWLRTLVPGAGEVPPPAGAAYRMTTVETKIVFDDVEPLRFEIDGDELLIILKAQFQPGGQAVLPQMEVTIPARLVIDKETVHLNFDNIKVKSLTDERTATLGMAEGIVQQSIQANFPRLSLPRQLPPELWNRSGTPPSFNYARAADGWLGIGID